MPTLTIEPSNGAWTWGGQQTLKDGDAVVATNRMLPWPRSGCEISTSGRHFTARRHNHPKRYVLVDDATGQPMINLVFTVLQAFEETAEVSVPSGLTLYWTLNRRHNQPMTGFYDKAGNEVLTLGHLLPWRPSNRHGVWGNLWRYWFAFSKSASYYQVNLAEEGTAGLLGADETIVLVMLAAHLEASKYSRGGRRHHYTTRH